MRPMNVPARAAVVVALALTGSGCVDDTLRELHPRISLCPAADSAATACDAVLDVGDVGLGKQSTLDVFVKNRGDGRLSVLSAAIDADDVSVAAVPETVAAGGAEALALSFQVGGALGPRTATLHVISDDDERPDAAVDVAFNVIPPPTPQILLCDSDAEDATCGPTLDVDLGDVRPTQGTSRAIFVRNAGDATLSVEEVRLQGSAEIALDSSARGGTLEPGESAAVVIVYAPTGPGDDAATLRVASDDPATPEATAVLHGRSPDNEPPTAVAVDSVTLAAAATVQVGDQVGIVGTASADPEGDPLVYRWTLEGPAGSAALIDDAAAENAVFVPDVRGSYTLSLVVIDSLGLQSAAAVVVVEATPRFAFRARVSWTGSADVDVHLVESGSVPFSARDCRYDNRTVAAGDPTSALDDAVLLDDADQGPGSESVVLEAPVAGSWQVWVHVFDDAGQSTSPVTVDLIRDDDGTPALTLTRNLGSTCDLWHAADVTLPGVVAVDVGAATTQQCP